MAKGPPGIVWVIGGAVAVAIALAALYLTILAPKSQREKMQGEVRDLAERWAEVRECFYGETPRSRDPGDALILRELTTTGLETELAVCEETLREARRAEGPSSGVAEVEEAWGGLRDARRSLGRALALRLQRPQRRPIDVLRGELLEAAVEAEAAYAGLREAAGLDPDPIDGPEVARAELRAIEVAGEPAAQVWVENNALLAGRASDGERTLQQFGPDGPSPAITARASELSGFGGRWVARLEETDGRARLVAAELEAPEGSPEGSEPRQVEIARLGPGSVISGALDNGRGTRVVVAHDRAAQKLVLFRSTDAGQSWTREVIAGDVAGRPRHELLPIQRRLIIGVPPNLRFEIGGPDLQVASRPRYATACLAETHSWWLTDRGLSVGPAGGELSPVVGSEDMPWLVNSCTDQQALGLAPIDPDIELPAQSLRLCGRADCKISARLPRAKGANAAALIAPLAGPMVAFEIDEIAMLWVGASSGSGLTPRTWMRLPEGAELMGLLEWGGQVQAVIESESGYALATFPGER